MNHFIEEAILDRLEEPEDIEDLKAIRQAVHRQADPSCRQPRSVVVAGLEKLDAVSEDFVNEAIRLVDPTRPHVASEVFERFWLANTGEGISQHCLDQIQDAQGSLAIGVDPVAEILEAFVLQDRGPRAL